MTDPMTREWVRRTFGHADDEDQERRPQSVPREGNNPPSTPPDAAFRQYVRQLFGYDV